MTDMYGQPEPFDPAALTRVPGPGNKKAARPIVPIVAALALAVAAFGAGFGVANAVAPKATADANGFTGRFGPGSSFQPRTGGGFGGGGFGGGASGTIGSLSSDQMTITTANGSQRIVLLTPSTTVTKVSTTTESVSDLTSGETVTVIGSANPDGSVTATSVVIGELGGLGRGFGGGGGGPNASGTPTTNP